MTSFKQDLVFSIVLERAGGSMSLKKVVLSFPIGPTDRGHPNLMKTYDGSVKMLSNLRFNVLAQPGTDKLSLTLLPRTESGNVLAAHVGEMSFLMSGVNVNVYQKPQRTVKISYREKYLELREEVVKTFNVPLVPSL